MSEKDHPSITPRPFVLPQTFVERCTTAGIAASLGSTPISAHARPVYTHFIRQGSGPPRTQLA